MKKTKPQILEGYWRVENCPTRYTDAYRWVAVKVELKGALPAYETQTTKEHLKALNKSNRESLSELIKRFITLARSLIDRDKIHENRGNLVMFQKLPRTMQQQLSILDVNDWKFTNFHWRAINIVDWMSISVVGTYSQTKFQDFIGID